MKRFLNSVFVFCLAVMVSLVIVVNANAALEFPTIALTDVTTIAAGMLGLLGAVWALRKALGFLGR